VYRVGVQVQVHRNSRFWQRAAEFGWPFLFDGFEVLFDGFLALEES
jgi:hypothetical protein